MSVSLVALAGLPPSPLFVSELLIALGGIAAGEAAVAAVAVVALALGFLGLLHALIEGILPTPSKTRSKPSRRGERRILVLTGVLGGGLLALTACSFMLPGSTLVERLL
jgi:hydrogenase-4 component F